jgi:phosphate transport system substrate-binding protein
LKREENHARPVKLFGYNFFNPMNRSFFVTLTLAILVLAGCSSASGATPSTGGNASAPSVSIQNKGSDTIVNLALAWAERYQADHPQMRISVSGGGSGTGITALIDGTVDIANASRAMKAEEIEAAQAKGIEPVEHVIARDAIAVIVNPHNPVQQLTLEQISLIYKGLINNWQDVGGEDRPIVRLSRETNSGTHVYFLEEVVRLGDKKDKTIFAADTLLLPSSEGIIAEVSDNPNAIGYDGLGYVVPEVKVIAVARRNGDGYVMPSVETVNNGEYPVSRDLYMYTGDNVSPDIQAYLDWILSPDAQQIVVDLGFVPVSQ